MVVLWGNTLQLRYDEQYMVLWLYFGEILYSYVMMNSIWLYGKHNCYKWLHVAGSVEDDLHLHYCTSILTTCFMYVLLLLHYYMCFRIMRTVHHL